MTDTQSILHLRLVRKYQKLFLSIIIVLAYAKVFIYYLFFNVNISQYISIADFLLISLDGWIIFILGVIAFYCIVYMSIPTEEVRYFKSWHKHYLARNNWPFYLLGTLLLAMSIWLLFYDKGAHRYFGLMSFIFPAFLFYVIFLKSLFFHTQDCEPQSRWEFLSTVHFTYILVFLVYVATISKVGTVKSKGFAGNEMIFYFSSKEIVCYDSIKFVGRTSDYVFFYDQKKDETFVEPTEELKRTTIKSFQLFKRK